MKFRYTILISGTNGAVQKDIEADNISKAAITAKARVKEIWGLTAKLKQKIISREKDFYKDEYYSQNKETGRYKKEFTLIVKALNKTQDSGSRVFDRLFKLIRIKDAKQFKVNCLGTGIFKPFSKNIVGKSVSEKDAIIETMNYMTEQLIKNGVKGFKWQGNSFISDDGKSKMGFRVLDNLRKTPLWSVVFKSPLNHTKSGLIVSPIRAETKADAIKIFYKEHPRLKGKGEIVSVTQGTPPSVKRTDLVQKRPKIGDDLVKGLDNKPLRTKYTISYDAYYTAGVKLNNGKYSRSETEKRVTEVIATSKQEALQKLKNGLKKAERVGYRYSNFKIIKIEREPVYEKLSEQEKLKLLLGERI